MNRRQRRNHEKKLIAAAEQWSRERRVEDWLPELMRLNREKYGEPQPARRDVVRIERMKP